MASHLVKKTDCPMTGISCLHIEESKKKKVVFSFYSEFVIINNFHEKQKEPKILGFEMIDSFVGFG